jgi:hypothetical protein
MGQGETLEGWCDMAESVEEGRVRDRGGGEGEFQVREG